MIIKLKNWLKKPAASKSERLRWFMMLYALSVIVILIISGLLHGLTAVLIKFAS